MIARWTQSGWLIQSELEFHGNFEVITSAPPPLRGLINLCHHQGQCLTGLKRWNEADRIRSSQLLKPFYGAACILSRYGNVEVVIAQTDGSLAHFWRQGIFGWRGPCFLPGGSDGPPAFIQSRYGTFGNFEVVVPCPDGGLSHFWRDNDHIPVWYEAENKPCATGKWTGLGLIHRSDGNLEIVGVADGNLVYLFQHGIGREWELPQLLGNGFQGRPCLLQNAAFPNSNFLCVAAAMDGGLACLVRNKNTEFVWRETGRFGQNTRGTVFAFDDVTMIQSSFGYAEVVARELSTSGLRLKHYRKIGWQWEGPHQFPFVACDP